LLAQFPGKTLDELDHMDMLRYFRAMDARKIDNLEEMAANVKSGKMKGADVSKEDWEEIRKHEKIWEQFLQGPKVKND
jgi:hypothetical protein